MRLQISGWKMCIRDSPKAAQMEESGLTFLGMAGMEDPVRPEAAEAVEQFARAGVQMCIRDRSTRCWM